MEKIDVFLFLKFVVYCELSTRQNNNMSYNNNVRAFTQNARQHLDQMRKNYTDVKEMLDRIEKDLKIIDDRIAEREKAGEIHAPIPQTVRSPQYPPEYVKQPVKMVQPLVFPVKQVIPVSHGYDISKIDPIFREAAKDPALKISFMDCSDLAMQCAYVLHKRR
jgi:hypothetical protein